MLDSHERIIGFLPSIFGIPSYSIFFILGILAGLLYYIIGAKKRETKNNDAITIVASALIFGFIGSKIPLLFETRDLTILLTGKSILGGLVGGMFGVLFIKKVMHINLKMGNVIAPSVALGMAVGRIGCFFNGCCYGIKSTFGYDFGDGCLRIPTQLLEVAFHLTAFILLHFMKDRVQTQGLLFKLYLLSYFIFRFFIEFIRENPIVWFHMSIYQLICLLGVVYISITLRRMFRKTEQNSNCTK